MSYITFTNGLRIFTPQHSAKSDAQMVPEIKDLNQDGEIDILDYSTVLAYTLVDYNNDGVIDILDALEYNSRDPGGIIPGIVTVPTIPPKAFDLEKCCDTHYPDKRNCYEFKNQITKISTCLPCSSTKLEEAVCKACATIPSDPGTNTRMVEIYAAGTEPTNPAVKLGKGKTTVTQDGVTYVVWCSMIAHRQCLKCQDKEITLPNGSTINECEAAYHFTYRDDVLLSCAEPDMWYVIKPDPPGWLTGGGGGGTVDVQCWYSQEECMMYWFKINYPYPILSTPVIGTFLWNPVDQVDMCKCADLTQDYDPCRYGSTIQQCIEENGGSIDSGPSV